LCGIVCLCGPAFSLTQTHNLLTDPAQVGLTLATDCSDQRFPGLSATPLCVSQAQQEVNADFTPTGFVATAVTQVYVARGIATEPDEHPTVTMVDFDRPFGLLAVERSTGTVMVAAWVENPDLEPTLKQRLLPWRHRAGRPRR
jgi:serine protease inhibitor